VGETAFLILYSEIDMVHSNALFYSIKVFVSVAFSRCLWASQDVENKTKSMPK